MRVLYASLVMGSFLLAVVCLCNLPLLAALVVIRRRIGRPIPAVVIAASFAATAAYVIWTVEWTDVYRHGMPSFGYFFRTMIVYAAAMAAIGWFAGRRIGRSRADASQSR
jgi:hypothetical protein